MPMQVRQAFVQCVIGTCVWLLLSEIFPMTIRGFAMGIAVFVLWTTTPPSPSRSPSSTRRWARPGTFGIFALITIVSIFFVTTFVPETKSHSLEALEDNFPRHDAAHLVHTPATVAGS